MNEMEFEVVEAPVQSLDRFIILLDQVGEWLWKKGVRQWKPGVHRENKDKIAQFVENGCLILVYHKEKLAGGCILSEIMPKVWSDIPDDALYLSSLVVARFAAGKGVGTQIIKACTQSTTNRGKSLIRLDCWDGNDFLKSYYQRQGFRMLDAIHTNGCFLRLFEKQINPNSQLPNNYLQRTPRAWRLLKLPYGS